jgi:hypothetical protein
MQAYNNLRKEALFVRLHAHDGLVRLDLEKYITDLNAIA